jgi:hypothetical protein
MPDHVATVEHVDLPLIRTALKLAPVKLKVVCGGDSRLQSVSSTPGCQPGLPGQTCDG